MITKLKDFYGKDREELIEESKKKIVFSEEELNKLSIPPEEAKAIIAELLVSKKEKMMEKAFKVADEYIEFMDSGKKTH